MSRCLLGEEVRYNGGHKRDRFVTEVLSRHVEWLDHILNSWGMCQELRRKKVEE
ncbi:MAG TPA: hypothetical protein VIU63_01130 [Nitrospira sp.]